MLLQVIKDLVAGGTGWDIPAGVDGRCRELRLPLARSRDTEEVPFLDDHHHPARPPPTTIAITNRVSVWRWWELIELIARPVSSGISTVIPIAPDASRKETATPFLWGVKKPSSRLNVCTLQKV